MQLQMVQQLPGDPGVLGGDKIRFGQRLAAAVRDIGQIADGGGEQIYKRGDGGDGLSR